MSGGGGGVKDTALPASKRMRLSHAGELRALGRLLPELDPEIKHRLRGVIVMTQTQDVEILDAYVKVEGADLPIYVSEETSHAIYADAWAGLEARLVDANAAYNATRDEPHARALALLEALREAARFADVVYSLTPIPDEEIEDKAS
jgi:predicted ABC-type transport system involved in lysophospholipase L1 biosynthesis ATPase subunit